MSKSYFSRRAQMHSWVPAEKAIYDAAQAVEAMPADVRLTDAVILLSKARELVADFVDTKTAHQEQAARIRELEAQIDAAEGGGT